MTRSPETDLTPLDQADFRRLAGLMVPASAADGMPGADDETIFADIMRSLCRDRAAVATALAKLREFTGGPFTALDEATAEPAAMRFLAQKHPSIAVLGRVVLQCYYRDDRVFRSLGLEPRSPFPKGHTLAPTDWSLLDGIRTRPRMWRDVDRTEA